MGDASSFNAALDNLEAQVHPGKIEARVEVDQVYAKYQELRDDLMLHGGGQHHYLRDSVYEQEAQIMEAWRETLITDDGSDLQAGTRRAAETIAAGVYDRAPFEFGDLKASPHPQVIDAGSIVYDRPPMMHRLSTEELRAKGDLRRLGLGNARSDAEVEQALGGAG